MRILLIGPPGVGKGTQAALLRDRTGAFPLASGDIFRYEIQNETELGKLASAYIQRGELVPDEVTIGMMSRHLARDEVKQNGYILDGFPRTVEQAIALDHVLDDLNLPFQAVVSIEVPEEMIVSRLSGRLICTGCGAVYHREAYPPQTDGVCDRCGSELKTRPDDNPETVRKRLQVFRESTAPVIAYYSQKGLLRRVDGSLPPETVYEHIVDGLLAKS